MRAGKYIAACSALAALAALAAGITAFELTKPKLVRIAEATAWAPRDSSAEFAYKGKLWIFGGWKVNYPHMLYDAWSSADGVNWDLVEMRPPIEYPDLKMSIVFKDQMWLLGGGGEPDWKIPATNAVWSSTDGKNWTHVTSAAAWSPRVASSVVAFKEKLWVLGGLDFADGKKSLKNDVWSSTDGKTWELVTASAPWSPRAFHAAVAMNGRLWVLGGGSYTPEYHSLSDVWSSEDGKSWVKEVDAPWPSRLWFSAVTYRDHMWVIGGWSKKDLNYGDIWYSRDGRTWSELKPETKWRPRHEHSTFVLDDKLWIAGGHADPLTNEVWTLEVPRYWPWSMRVAAAIHRTMGWCPIRSCE